MLQKTSPRKLSKPSMVAPVPVSKRSANFLTTDFIDCLPTFIHQLKLRGLREEDDGGKIILQMAHRALRKPLMEQQQYTLVNTANDFVTFLSNLSKMSGEDKISNEDLEEIINLLLDNLSAYEAELLVTFILKREHMDSPNDYARGTSLAGQLIKLISARTGGQFFNDYLLYAIKPLETLIERNPYHFAKYAYNLKEKQVGSLSPDGQGKLNKALEGYLAVLHQLRGKMPALFRLVCHVVDGLDFLDYRVKATLLEGGTEESIVNTASIKECTYVVNYQHDATAVYYLNSKRKLTILVISEIEGLADAIMRKSVDNIEASLMPYHNSRLKRDRKVGLINTRFFGYIITKRCEALFNPNADLGAIMLSAVNMLLIESLHALATNKPLKDPYLNDFVCEKNKKLLEELYNDIPYQEVVEEAVRLLPDSTLLLEEQKIIYIAFFTDILKRFQGVCTEVAKFRVEHEKKKSMRLLKTHETRVQEMTIDPNKRTLVLADCCDFLNSLKKYMDKARELPKIQGLYREIMEMSLHYLLHTIVRPYALSVSAENIELYEHAELLAQAEFEPLSVVVFIKFLEETRLPWASSLQKRIRDDAQLSDKINYKAFLRHIDCYLKLFCPDFSCSKAMDLLATKLAGASSVAFTK